LHAKLYLFDANRVVVTSANLTEAALTRNQEFGFVADEAAILATCADYFERLWERAGPNLTLDCLERWESQLRSALACGSRPAPPTFLKDEGADAGIVTPPIPLLVVVAEASQWFVKFFGDSTNRADRSVSVLDEVRRSGSHRACTYPKGKR